MRSRPTLTVRLMSAEQRIATPRTDGYRAGVRAGLIGLVLVCLAVCGLLAASSAAWAASQPIVELPVAFQVANTNTSMAPCPSTGATFTVRGHITGPRSALLAGTAKGITVYLFGYEAGEWNWDLKGVPGYDYASEMAKRGHVSLTLDELGYGASDHPANGNETCQGAEADITHQIIQKLRNREYTLAEAPVIGYSKVVLAGHDVGGQVAEMEAYSYADIDGLVLVTWADQGQTPYIIERATLAANDSCTKSASGYVHFISEREFRTLLFYKPTARVLNATSALRNANPCGIIRSTPTGVPVDKANLSKIEVPVLIVWGNNETVVWTRQGEEEQQGDFSGSSDKSTVFIPEAGHFPMFEKTAPLFDAVMSRWLGSRFPGS